ncbi:tetratricopeptide repeat protein [Pseudoalteromonas aurantia]|uniref:Tetratricopeptide repeat protein n=1 Tax=Pseudoalteromonas aurantia 208 TaxID=1314867 RepID=A0ABR9EHW4_9GAMM|nr:hypothetical protein [Pseudoalteromonas aurantia]MBE0370571.1 hypothetical protein [Pseudoalteromonas aurantia 208]
MIRIYWALFIGLSFSTQAEASLDIHLRAIQQAWVVANYELFNSEQEEAFETLVSESQNLVINYPNSAESHIWHGIVQSSYAGAKGGIGALGLAKSAKVEFERAISINESALNGSALTSLGTLYSKVPGWPIGFGNDKKAVSYFKKSLLLNPTGLDINYFYGQFLYDERQYKQALDYLQTALLAPSREGREKADEYRKGEVAVLLQKINKKLKSKR